MELVTQRTPQGHLNSVRSRLGKAAVIGGVERALREVTSDRFADTLKAARDAEARRKILETARNVVEKARLNPRTPKPPSPNDWAKVRWTDEVIARFKRLAPFIKDNARLAVEMGYPAFCAGSMSAARYKYLPRAAATGRVAKNRPGAPLAGALALAA